MICTYFVGLRSSIHDLLISYLYQIYSSIKRYVYIQNTFVSWSERFHFLSLRPSDLSRTEHPWTSWLAFIAHVAVSYAFTHEVASPPDWIRPSRYWENIWSWIWYLIKKWLYRLELDYTYTYTKRAAWSDFCMKNVTIVKSTDLMKNVDRQRSNIEYVCKQKDYDGDYIYIYFFKEEIFWFERGCFLCTRMQFGRMPIEETMTLSFSSVIWTSGLHSVLFQCLDKVTVSLCWMPMLGGKTYH